MGKVDEGREALSQLRESEESSAQVEAEVKRRGRQKIKRRAQNKTGMEESTE